MAGKDKPRIHYIDFMKGLCILFIVVSHTDDRLFTLVGNNMDFTLQSFRIPMYYFISGIFFKTYNGFSDFSRKKVNNIMVPLVFFYLAAFAFHWLGQYLPPAQHFYGPFEWSSIFDPFVKRAWPNNVPLWFLLSLFEVNIIYYLLQKYAPNRHWVWIGSFLLSLIGYYVATHHLRVLQLVDTALIGLPYFILGSEVNRNNLLQPSRYDKWGWIGLLAFILILRPFAQEINILHQHLPNYLYLYLVPATAISLLLLTCKRLPYIPVINYIGRYSLVVLCTHYPLVRPFHRFMIAACRPYPIGDLTVSLMAVLSLLCFELLLIALLTRLLPYFTAQKELFTTGWHLAWPQFKLKAKCHEQ